MTARSMSISLSTKGNADILDITNQVSHLVAECGIKDGIVTVFSPSSTSALTTIEFESGALKDLQRLFDEMIPQDRHYAHNARWGDGNGHSHVRAALVGPSISIPIVSGRLSLGTWQQVIFIDFDVRSRRRELVVQVIGD